MRTRLSIRTWPFALLAGAAGAAALFLAAGPGCARRDAAAPHHHPAPELSLQPPHTTAPTPPQPPAAAAPESPPPPTPPPAPTPWPAADTLPPGEFSDPLIRSQAVAKLAARSRTEREEALAEAARHGWPTRMETNGTVWQLQAIRNGKPYYRSTLNINAGISTAASFVRRTPPYNLTGTGVTAGVWDGGSVRATHQELRGRVSVIDSVSAVAHSTHVCGTMLASGVTANAIGMAPQARVDSYDWDEDIAEMASRGMADPGETNSIQVSNHSYGYLGGWQTGNWSGNTGPHWFGNWGDRESDNFGAYDWSAVDFDTVCYGAPYYLPFQAAGNDRDDGAPGTGTIFYYFDDGWKSKAYSVATDPYSDGWNNGGFDTVLLTGNAKNPLTIGSVGDAVSGTNRSLAGAYSAGYSGWGPADDGRVKPDLVANGESLYSCDITGDNKYYTSSGTSMATPDAAGSALLLLDCFGRLFPGSRMRASTLKGLILHTADDLGRPGPDYTFGWGLMNTKAGADLLRAHAAMPGAGLVREAVLTESNPVHSASFLWDGSNALRVSLCWTDPPGEPIETLNNRDPRVVHDLDLRVIAPDGQTNYPYRLSPTTPLANATTGDNTVDVFEVVHLAAPPATGVYTAVVSAKLPLVEGGAQVYSLLASGATVPASIAHEPLVNTTNTATPYAVEAVVTPAAVVDTNGVTLAWSTNGPAGPFATQAMQVVSGTLFRAELPAQPLGASVRYWISATTLSGYATTHPSNAPAGLHRFDIVEPVALTVSGSPPGIGTVEPPYGLNPLASAAVVRASADAFTAASGLVRYACAGWAGGGDVPPAGASNAVSFTLLSASSIEWQWTNQFGLAQTSSVPGLLDTVSWWHALATAATVEAAASLAQSGTTYRFAGWMLDGARQPADTGTAVNPVTGIAMDTTHVAAATYLDESADADADGLPDWWERLCFGTNDAVATEDPDGDGFPNDEEYADGADPHAASSTPAPPALSHAPLADPQGGPAPWPVTATATDNYRIASVTLWWQLNGGGWQSAALTNGTNTALFAGAIPAPGAFGDAIDYRLVAADPSGRAATSGVHSFGVAYAAASITPAGLGPWLARTGEQVSAGLIITNAGNASLAWSLAFGQAGMTDAMESGEGAWTHGGRSDRWHLSTNRAFSASHAWYCGIDSMHEYLSRTDARLVTPPVFLGAEARLAFRHWAKFELGTGSEAWDGGVIEISTNGGATFQAIDPVGGYPYTVVSNLASPFYPHQPCYAGTGGWQAAEFDLSTFAGRTVHIAFRFGSDGYTVSEGWYIDDVAITPTGGTSLAAWLSADALAGEVPPASATSVAVTASATDVPTGSDLAGRLAFTLGDPVAPSADVPVSLRVRTPPAVTLSGAAQTSRDGSGRVSIGAVASDADGERCDLALQVSLDGGASWTNLALTNAWTAQGPLVVSNAQPFQFSGLPTTSGGAPAPTVLTAQWASAAGTAPVTLATAALVRAAIRDAWFNGAAATSAAFLVDNEPPAAPAGLTSLTHSVSAWATQSVVSLAWLAASDGAGSGVAGYGVAAGTNGALEAPASATVTGLAASAGPVADGTGHWCAVRAVDTYGNAGPSARLGPLRVDTVPPSAAGATVVPALSAFGAYAVGPSVSASWSGFADSGSGVAGYYAALSNGGGTTGGAWAAGAAATLSGAVLEATNTVYAWAQDAAGLIGQAASAPVLVLDPAADRDGDSFSAAAEELAATDARDAGSFFAIASIAPATGGTGVAVSWADATNRLYSLLARESATGGAWLAVAGATNLPGTGAGTTIVHTAAGATGRVYRITVRSAD